MPFTKHHIIRSRNKKANKCNSFVFGDYALVSKSEWFIRQKHFKSIESVLSKKLEKKGSYLFRIYPHHPRTQKSEGVRRGSGKGSIAYFYAKVYDGTFIVEISANANNILKPKEAKAILRQCGYKLPVRTKIVSRPKKGDNQ